MPPPRTHNDDFLKSQETSPITAPTRSSNDQTSKIPSEDVPLLVDTQTTATMDELSIKRNTLTEEAAVDPEFRQHSMMESVASNELYSAYLSNYLFFYMIESFHLCNVSTKLLLL